MLSNNWLALAVIYVSVFCAGASFKCSPREKEITKPIRSTVEINCQLDNVLQPDEYFILEKGETEIGQCSLDGCNSTDPNSFELSLKKLNCTFQIRDLESDDSGAYYASLKNTSSVLFNRVLALNLSVNQIISQPICGINWRKSSREIELSCEAILHSRPNLETSLQLIMMDNGTEVKVNSSLNNNLKSTQVYSVYMYNLVKLVTRLNAILTRALVPTKCVLMTSQKSNFCWYPQYIGMNFAMTADSFFGCGEKKLEVWLISNDFKLLKMHSLKPTIVDTRMANGNSFIVICGMETRGLIEIRSITKVKVKKYDTCYTARVEEHWMQTGLRIVPGCVSTPKFDPSSYRPNFVSITPNVSLPIQATDYISSSTEIPTTALSNSLSTVYFMSNEPTTKQMSKKLNRYLKYATLLLIVASVALLLTITSCLFLAHQKMNASDGKNLRLQYYRYDRQGDGLASVRRDDLATASTANLTSLLVNSPNGSQLHFIQVQSVSGSDGCNGEVSGALVHRPVLPPRGHPEESNHEAYHGRRINSAEVGKTNAFAMVTSKCDQRENYPPARPASEPKFCSATAVPKDSESIYHTVNDMHQDVYQDALSTQLSDGATYALCPGAYADLQKEHEISALGQPGKRDDRVDNHSHNEEGKCTVLDPDPDIQVKELLYAKPNKRGKSTSLSSAGILEYLVEGSSCNEPTALESSEYAELRQSP